MSSGKKIYDMLEHLTVPETEANVDALLNGLPDATSPQVISFVNAHAVNLMVKDEGLFKALIGSDILLRDGSGMKILMKWLNQNPGANLNGTDLIPRIIEKFDGMKVAVFGTQEPWLSKGCDVIETRGGTIVSRLNGFQDEAAYIEAIETSKPDLVILAMGMPKQEMTSMALRAAASWPTTIVNGGAIIDFLAERVNRAPETWRKLGMEWLYRLIQEPKRLFGRYVVGNVIFLTRGLILCVTQANPKIT
ncbi:WecB/TagA/CpsF family glycosyltransferase [Hirschia baltica]|uniref:Glycosyl transferase, WecB/TagA/CpsF family n=1 Tax=Hirschia baltica (strain ATCC 49814 / DSM 5838 / IFAM 1418) TaxID=582402 RepID=C6XN01_HIRBI|nr:WecB/TagA/CpsF family glycosyltransferase [Hirschia baltica]ACT58171.1 glycosyl transferase, WecB/TagA/CpsF family [Hirschia baltica ATCC 49814]